MPGCAHVKGAWGPCREDKLMLELLTLALCIQTLPCTQILGGGQRESPQREEGTPKKF